MSRKTLSDDFVQQLDESPFDTLTTPVQPKVSKSPPHPRTAAVKPLQKARMTVQLSESVLETAKNAVFWTPGLTLAQLTEEALKEALERLEKKRKEPFPKRQSELKAGRPVK